ncbi:hypothetical protein G7Y89_g6161 [Cudoniella acicularis]|uniref:Glucose-methanol-choline oxidoreductase N-terminal domain-containing protein n=1 Tax=Cudoniella acicularis TaxID=354080 RepID=A0A8H4RMS2_9HELO|nr:hypothetical protein G7Y89_g6161 [Cudoniella acicularis]
MAYSIGLVLALQILSLLSSTAAVPNGPQPRNTTFSEAKEQTYDYIIVGGGLTGLVVANRLSEDPEKTVLVIENGYVDNGIATYIPYKANILNVADMYPITSAPEPFLGNRTYPVRVGNVVGGGSIVNGMVFDRGSDADYDAWEQLGNDGWGWAGLKPYFFKSNHFTAPSESSVKEFGITYNASAYGNGPIQVSVPSFQFKDIKTIFGSWKVENVPMPIEGFAEPIGAYWLPNDINNATATRSNAHVTYFVPVENRTNLKLLTGTRVNKVLFDNSYGNLIANGVRMVSHADGTVAKAYANREVILAAGGVFTPHLLLLSGIGPQDVLAAANVTVLKDTPAVGSNFQDHPSLSMTYNLSNEAFPNPNSYTLNATFLADASAQYSKDHTGPWSFGRGSASAFLTFKQFSSKWQSITAKISQQNPLDFLPARYSQNPALLAGYMNQREMLIQEYLGDTSAIGEYPIQAWGHASAALEKPLSRGILTLNASNPQGFPVVQWNALQNPVDAEVLVELIKFNRAHWARKELAVYNPVELLPGAQYQTNEEIIQGSISTGTLSPTFAHPSGGCAMMPEELGGVVSDRLLVYGTERLSVVDASIIPMIPATHLQATMYAVAEKAADIIKSRAGLHASSNSRGYLAVFASIDVI